MSNRCLHCHSTLLLNPGWGQTEKGFQFRILTSFREFLTVAEVERVSDLVFVTKVFGQIIPSGNANHPQHFDDPEEAMRKASTAIQFLTGAINQAMGSPSPKSS